MTIATDRWENEGGHTELALYLEEAICLLRASDLSGRRQRRYEPVALGFHRGCRLQVLTEEARSRTRS